MQLEVAKDFVQSAELLQSRLISRLSHRARGDLPAIPPAAVRAGNVPKYLPDRCSRSRLRLRYGLHHWCPTQPESETRAHSAGLTGCRRMNLGHHSDSL